MKCFTLFSLILLAAVLLMGHVVFWVPQAQAHSMTTTHDITENTSGPVKLDVPQLHQYSIDSTDSDSQKRDQCSKERAKPKTVARVAVQKW